MHTKRAMAVLAAAVTLDMISFGIAGPVLPTLVRSLAGSVIEGAKDVGIFATAFALMQLVFSPILGLLSDRFGRRPILVLSIAGLGADYVLMALAPDLRWLFLGRIIAGVCASNITTATAYIADVQPPEKRSAAIGIIYAAFGIGFIVGPLLGGLLGTFGARVPFWAAAGLNALTALAALLALPESLARTARTKHLDWKRANPIAALKLLAAHPELRLFGGMQFIGYLAQQSYAIVFVFYGIDRYGWNTLTVGLTLAAVGLTSALAGIFAVKAFVARFGERAAIIAGLACGGAGFALFGLAPNTALFIVGVGLNSLWALAGASMTTMMTQRVGPSDQGQLQGAIASTRSIAMLIGPLIFSATYAISVRPEINVPGASWFVAAALLGLSLTLGILFIPRDRAVRAASA